MSNTPKTHKNITVDGVTYDIESGSIVTSNITSISRNSDSIRSPQKAQQKHMLNSAYLKQSMGVIELPRKNKLIKPDKVSKAYTSLDQGFGFYFLKALLPRGFSAASWIFSVLRAITSPQAWFLATLPILILSFQNVIFENINNILEKIHLFSQDGRVFHALPDIVLLISIILVIVFVRVLFNVIAMHLRMTYLSSHKARLWPAIRLTLHNSLKIIIHNIVHGLYVLLVSVLTLGIVFGTIWQLQSTTLQIFLPYIVGFIGLIAIAVISLLHAKHWIQIAILSSTTKTMAIQRRSLAIATSFPVKSVLLGIMSFGLTLTVCLYGVWVALLTIEWLNRDITPANVRFVVLISSVFALALAVSYLQQSIWTAFSSWANNQYTPRLFTISSEKICKSVSTWQIWVSTYLVIMAIAIMSLVLVFIMPVANSIIVRASSYVPDKIELPHINR